MNFTRDSRKEVFDFFASILSNYYTEPVYYEYVRGHASKAPEIVKQYILKKCKGDNLLEYFRKRKNYFDVEGTRISLRKEPRTKSSPENASNEKKRIWKPPKFNRKRNEDSCSNVSEDSCLSVSEKQASGLICTEKLEHEDYIYKHFIRLLEGNKVVKIESIDFESLPKKVIRHLSLYCNKSIINYFSKFPDIFVIDDNRNVYLSNETKNCSHSDLKNANLESEENEESIFISPEVRSAYIWLESIEFFLVILKKKKTKFVHVDRLASYLSQASEGVKTFLKSYKPFKTFFFDAPLVFSLNDDDEVSLSDNCSYVLQLAKSGIRSASEGSFPESGGSLTSYLHDVVRTQYSFENESSDEDLESECETDFEHDEGELENYKEGVLEKREDENVEQVEDKNIEPSSENSVSETIEQSSIGTFENEVSHDEGELENYKEGVLEKSEDENVEQGEYKNIEPSNEKSVSKTIEQSNKGTFENEVSLNISEEGFIKGEEINDPERNAVSSTNSKDNVHNDIKLPRINNSDECDAKFLRFLFTVQLFCAETVENEIDYSSRYKIKAIEFFVDILKASSQNCTLTSLHGTLGQAPTDIISFMNKMYKGEKFSSFFQEHEEFLLKSSLVSLALTYNDSLQTRHDLLSKSEHKFCFEDLYESNRYKNVLKETFALFFEVYQRLMNSNKIKLNRLCNIIERFPDCLEWIKSSNGKTLPEKTETFFKLVNIFEFSEEGFVSFPSVKNNGILSKWLQQMSEAFQNSKLEMPVFKLVKDNTNTSRKVLFSCEKDCFWSLVEFFESIKNVMKDVNHSHYYELIGILPKELLFKIAESTKDSRIIISSLLENRQFLLKNGRITVNDSKHNSVHLNRNLSTENNSTVINVQNANLVNNILEKETEVVIATDIYYRLDGENSFLHIPLCEPEVNIKGGINKTDFSLKHSHNNIDENHVLLKPNCNVKGMPDDLGNDYFAPESLNQSEMQQAELDNDLNNSNKTEDPENANRDLKVSNNKLAIDSMHDLSEITNSGLQIIPNSNSCAVEQLINRTPNPNSQCQIIDCGKKGEMGFKNVENLPENRTLSTIDTVDFKSKNQIFFPTEIQNDNLSTIIVGENQNSKSCIPIQGISELEFSESIADFYDNTELSENFPPNLSHSEAATDFDSEVSDTQSLEEVNKVVSTIEDESAASSISDEESDNTCEVSELTILSLSEDKYQSNLLESKVNLNRQTIPPVSEKYDFHQSEINLCEKEKFLFTINGINFYKQNDPSLSSNEDLGFNEERNDNISQSVIENVPPSTRSVLVEDLVEEPHSDEKVDKYFEIKSSLNSVLESSRSFHAGECKENNQTKIMCDKGDISTCSKIKCEEGEISVTNQSAKIVSNKKLTNVGMKNIDMNCSKMMISDDISEMKYKANCLAREVFIKVSSFEKVFVATSSFIFYFKRDDIFDVKEDYNVLIENSFHFDNSSSRTEDGDFEELGTLLPSNLMHSTSTNDFNSLEKCRDLNKKFDVTENNVASFEYPLQPINAQIILLTVNSCIAQAEIASGKQNIYFLKCVFSCEEDNCCSDCFDALRVGDLVSCFVPITEMSCKMWIPIMVSKEESKNFKETYHINQVLQNQRENGLYRQCEVDFRLPCKKYNSEDISAQTEYLCSEHGCQTEISVEETFCQTEILLKETFCQTEILAEETFCQTDLSGDVKKKFASSVVMCQTSSVLVQDVSLQIGCATSSSDCQTDISGINAICVECQTDLMGSVKECVNCANSLSQTSLSGEVKELVNTVDSSSQTIATGTVMAMQYYHF